MNPGAFTSKPQKVESGGTMTLPPGEIGTDLKMGVDGPYFGFDSGGTSASVTNPTIANIDCGIALSENEFALPDGTQQFEIKSRSGRPIRLAFETGKLSTEYVTVKGFYGLYNLSPAASVSVFFCGLVASEIVEIISWV